MAFDGIVLYEVTVGPVGSHDRQAQNPGRTLLLDDALEKENLPPIRRPHGVGATALLFRGVVGQVTEMLAIRVNDMYIAVLRLKNDLLSVWRPDGISCPDRIRGDLGEVSA